MLLMLEKEGEDHCGWSAWGVEVVRDDIGELACRSWKRVDLVLHAVGNHWRVLIREMMQPDFQFREI